MIIRTCAVFLSLLVVAGSAAAQERQKKALFVILDGIPADVLERVATPHLDAISARGGFARATTGGEKGGYSQTPTISAPGYNTLLTGTWGNKHNVSDNAIDAPNYNYWTIFRFLKHQYPSKQTAIFSTWMDNRTKLVGVDLQETGFFTFDYYFDGFERDTLNFPHDDLSGHIRKIDESVAAEAASYVRRKAPDLSWVYLQYPDDMGHRFGDSEEMDEAVSLADRQIGEIWEAIQHRETHHDEEWLLIVTTDHGRTEQDGTGHGGQSDRERQIWIVTNSSETNNYFNAKPAMVDILPSITYFMEISVPKANAMELDGTSFLGAITASNLTAQREGEESVRLRWKAWSDTGRARVWTTLTNSFEEGGLDHYLLMDEVEIGQEEAVISLKGLRADFFKFVLETHEGYLNYWITEP